MKHRRVLIFLAAALALAGAVGTQSRTSVVAQTPGCAVSPNELAVDSEERSALDLINALRAENRAPALALSSTLGQAAAHKSSSMAANGSFSHDDPGRSFAQRIRDCGYRATPNVAENIAAGVDSGRAVVQMWRDSPAHQRIMLDPSMRALGISRVRGVGGWYWTANFGGMMDGGSDAAAGSSSTSTASPAPPAPPTPPSAPATAAASQPAGSLQVGSAATVATDDGDCLNVRSGPGRAAPIVTCLADGTPVRLVDGPMPADGVTWWRLDGLGWAAGEYLNLNPRASR